jgi:hypothetical protein
MSESDVYANLSRILETHQFGDGEESGFDDFVEQVTADVPPSPPSANLSARGVDNSFSPPRPSPYDTWQSKHTSKEMNQKDAPVLSDRQWDSLVSHLYKGHRTKDGAVQKGQNAGLALELGGMEFKPRMNLYSLQLSKTKPPLLERVQPMLNKKEEMLKSRREQLQGLAVKECTFAPERMANKMSDKILRKTGRDAHKVQPDDLIRYEAEKQRRIEERRAVLDHLAATENTFRPKINVLSLKLNSKKTQNKAAVEMTEREKVTAMLKQKGLMESKHTGVVPGKPFAVQSPHPYKNNTLEYQPIQVPGAMAYSVVFDERSETETVYDFIKFYQDEAYVAIWGSGKYSGGVDGSPKNWPGTGGRNALIIPASTFIIMFKSNATICGWGFKITIQPYLCEASTIQKSIMTHKETQGTPMLMSRSKLVKDPKGRNVHERLYDNAVVKRQTSSVIHADLLKRGLNVSLKPWELEKQEGGKPTQGKKDARLIKVDDLLESEVDETGAVKYSEVEYDDSLALLWRSLSSVRMEMS